MAHISKNINPVGLTQALFFINAAIWLLFGIFNLIRAAQGHASEPAVETGILAALMFGNVAAMLWSGIELGKLQQRSYYLAVMVLTINIILIITEDFDLFNLSTILIDVVIFGLLIATHEKYALTSDEVSRPG